jgi:hypothetical protein
MKDLATLFNTRAERKIPDPRKEMIQFFHERIRDKKGKKFRASFIGMKLSHLSLEDLYYLKSICLDSENRGHGFSRCFWGSLRPK